MLKQLARTEPYYKRNQPHICSFYAKGGCNRGTNCPYRCARVLLLPPCELIVNLRHEMPVKNELSKQNIQDRYFGHNDPVARKILSGHAEKLGLKPPEDESVVSSLRTHLLLYFQLGGSLQPDVTIPLLFACDSDGRNCPHTCHQVITWRRSHIFTLDRPCGEVKVDCIASIVCSLTNIFLRLRCAFVNFKDRISAELAAEAWANGLDMDGERLGVRWGRSKNPPPATPSVSATAAT